jgi:hypothetical protein
MFICLLIFFNKKQSISCDLSLLYSLHCFNHVGELITSRRHLSNLRQHECNPKHEIKHGWVTFMKKSFTIFFFCFYSIATIFLIIIYAQ